ncbi:hypothetical protein GBA52_014123 [Prunus armeniaca]|nr:hypothetical protein GBA52_014123 [Prunus armeniaca]
MVAWPLFALVLPEAKAKAKVREATNISKIMVGNTSTKTTGVQTATNILIPASAASNDQPTRQPFFDCEDFFCIMCFVVPYFILAPLGLTLLLTHTKGYDPEFLVHSARPCNTHATIPPPSSAPCGT